MYSLGKFGTIEILQLIADIKFREGLIVLQGNIFSFQKFSIHDGPGIRTTVFFKGCPMHCIWCHNPESISFHRQVLYHAARCVHCGKCNNIYDDAATRIDKQAVDHFLTAERAVSACVTGALEIAGRYYSVKEAMKEILKDRQFYEESGGGVTFSGGECLAQIDFVEALATECKRHGISVVIDTCGYVPFQHFERVLAYCDLFLYDIKIIQPALHKEFTGVDVDLVLENLQKLSDKQANISLRFPIIDGINLNDEHIAALMDICRNIRHESVHLLPYHAIAEGKYTKLGQAFTKIEMNVPTENQMEQLKVKFEDVANNLKIGG